MRLRVCAYVCIYSGLLVSAQVGVAATIVQTFTSESAFQAALATPFYDSSADINALTLSLKTGPLSFAGNGFGFDINGTGSGQNLYVTDLKLGPTPKYLTPASSTESLVVGTFSSPGSPPSGVTALGGYFFATDGNESFVSQQVSLVFTFADTTTSSQSLTPLSVAGSYFGVIVDTPLSSLNVSTTTNFSTLGGVTVGVPVPEPGTFALLSGGCFLGIAVRLRRRFCAPGQFTDLS